MNIQNYSDKHLRIDRTDKNESTTHRLSSFSRVCSSTFSASLYCLLLLRASRSWPWSVKASSFICRFSRFFAASCNQSDVCKVTRRPLHWICLFLRFTVYDVITLHLLPGTVKVKGQLISLSDELGAVVVIVVVVLLQLERQSLVPAGEVVLQRFHLLF